jgi:hypothetical protein
MPSHALSPPQILSQEDEISILTSSGKKSKSKKKRLITSSEKSKSAYLYSDADSKMMDDVEEDGNNSDDNTVTYSIDENIRVTSNSCNDDDISLKQAIHDANIFRRDSSIETDISSVDTDNFLAAKQQQQFLLHENNSTSALTPTSVPHRFGVRSSIVLGTMPGITENDKGNNNSNVFENLPVSMIVDSTSTNNNNNHNKDNYFVSVPPSLDLVNPNTVVHNGSSNYSNQHLTVSPSVAASNSTAAAAAKLSEALLKLRQVCIK